MCTSVGTVFDLTNIIPWIKKHGANPVDGTPLKTSELIKLNFLKNDENEYIDPVTYKVFTDNTHLVALRPSGNVFAWDTVERLNIKAKNWRDLLSDAEFKRSDIITIQDPKNLESRNLSHFKYIQDGANTTTAEQETERAAGINDKNLGNAAKILKAKEAVAKARAHREQGTDMDVQGSANSQALGVAKRTSVSAAQKSRASQVPYNAAQYTSGQAAASFTSTGLTPTTDTSRVLMSDEEYMLKPKRVKQTGYAHFTTNHGSMNIALYPEFAPKAVWNFIQLAKRGYYNGVAFHRNIKNFMIQGGDPTGTGRGGQSCWGKNFADEFEGPLVHDTRGVLSMANKGKDTNTSQFFILYRAAPHLNRKHTIFGRVVEGLDVLERLEKVTVDDKSKPTEPCTIEDVTILIDPFEDFLKQRSKKEADEARKEQLRVDGGAEDDRTTWTGKRLRQDGTTGSSSSSAVGKYMKTTTVDPATNEGLLEADEPEMPPPTKRNKKAGGFGDFSGW